MAHRLDHPPHRVRHVIWPPAVHGPRAPDEPGTRREPAQSVWTTSITLFELEFGIESLPEGARKDSLAHKFDQLVDSLLERRVLEFDRASARAAAVIAGRLGSIGRRGEIADLQIAGIVSARKGLLATRNTGHFEHSEIALVDPWR